MPQKMIRLGIPVDEYIRPFIAALKEIYRQKAVTSPEYSGLSFEPLIDAVEQLLNGDLEAAFVSALDYAKNSSDLSIYPGFGISSVGESGLVKLLTKTDAKAIARLALGPASAQDAVLAKIVLSEAFEQDVEFVSTPGDVPTLLARADAVLVGSDAAVHLAGDVPVLDIAAEWTELTELPYVHMLCVGKKEARNKLVANLLREIGASDDLLPGGTTLGFGLEEREGLSEFFRYAFYLGILPDVPDIDLFGDEEQKGQD
jgi:chorismate dehydratase